MERDTIVPSILISKNIGIGILNINPYNQPESIIKNKFFFLLIYLYIILVNQNKIIKEEVP